MVCRGCMSSQYGFQVPVEMFHPSVCSWVIRGRRRVRDAKGKGQLLPKRTLKLSALARGVHRWNPKSLNPGGNESSTNRLSRCIGNGGDLWPMSKPIDHPQEVGTSSRRRQRTDDI
ncbi:hypothetical protein M514_09026 [Trichuris suis]|uniref:Uncharacterized protein n=1 Tax=Trichuris suis TaxID=68888 RepID=A0A085MZ96_9BILA|nr:hypothetical protein M513_09026 [Trichuris suis]KFD62542.1 hypothetical protein M514_09026 [Trichuris suis]